MIKSLAIIFTGGLLLFLAFSGIEISFKPFKIDCPNWRFGLGVIIMLTGSFFVYWDGLRDGKKEGKDMVIKAIEDHVDKTKGNKD